MLLLAIFAGVVRIMPQLCSSCHPPTLGEELLSHQYIELLLDQIRSDQIR